MDSLYQLEMLAEQSVAILTVPVSEFDWDVAESIRKQFEADRLLASNRLKRFVIDLSQVEILTSGGVRFMCFVLRQLPDTVVQFYLAPKQSMLRDLLARLGLSDYLTANRTGSPHA